MWRGSGVFSCVGELVDKVFKTVNEFSLEGEVVFVPFGNGDGIGEVEGIGLRGGFVCGG